MTYTRTEEELEGSLQGIEASINDHSRKLDYWLRAKQETIKKLEQIEVAKERPKWLNPEHRYCTICNFRINGYWEHMYQIHPESSRSNKRDSFIEYRHEFPCTCKKQENV